MRTHSIILSVAMGIALASASVGAEGTHAYRVRKGDGLDAIARTHHTTRADLLRLNPLQTPDVLDVGAVILVPQTSDTAPRERRAEPTRPRSHVASPRVARAPRPITPVTAPVSRPVASPKPVAGIAAVPRATAAPTAKLATTKIATAATNPPAAKPFLTEYKEPQKGENDLPLGRVIVDLIWKLALVLCIAYLSIYALRGVLSRQAVLPGAKCRLKVLESATLGPNRAVHLVRVGSKILVLGSTPDQITAIGEMSETDMAPAATPAPREFSGHLADAVAIVGEKGGALPEQFQGGITHIWDRVQAIRGLRGKGPHA